MSEEKTFEEEEGESNIYELNYRNELVENDEIDNDEAGFMDGYEKASEEE